MAPKSEKDLADARQGRLIGIVIAIAAVAHIAAPYILDQLGLDPSYANLISLFAIAAFIWSFVAAWRIWQRRREE